MLALAKRGATAQGQRAGPPRPAGVPPRHNAGMAAPLPTPLHPEAPSSRKPGPEPEAKQPVARETPTGDMAALPILQLSTFLSVCGSSAHGVPITPSSAADEEQQPVGGNASGEEDDEVQGGVAQDVSQIEKSLRAAETEMVQLHAACFDMDAGSIVQQLRQIVSKTLQSLAELAEVV